MSTSATGRLMIIWRGWGILAAVLPFGGLVVAQLAVDAIAGDGAYSAGSQLFGGIGVASGGAATYFIARWLERRNRPQRLVDRATGEEVVLQSRNDLFFIPMKYWGAIGVVGGLVLAVWGALSGG